MIFLKKEMKFNSLKIDKLKIYKKDKKNKIQSKNYKLKCVIF